MMFCSCNRARDRNAIVASFAAAAVLIAGAAADRAESAARIIPAHSAASAQEAMMQGEHISIRTIGSGPAVFLIPGLSSPRAVWDGVAPGLAANHTVHLVQVNGFGGGDPRANLEPGVLDGIVAELRGFIAERGIESPAIVGHSMGGLVGLMLAARHPDAVGRLMVVDAFPFFGTVMGAETVDAIRPRAEQMRAMLLAQAETGEATAGPVTSDPGGIWSITPEGRIQVANWSRAADQRVVAQAMYEDMVTDMRPELEAITARPFTVLYAAGMGEAQARAIWEPQYAGSGARMVAVPDSYHFIMLDQPEAFAAELEEFLAR
ncbi:alpha/beta fold hydrolase [Sphingosinithalassobacter sp. LHW66-3]|uniref:alpha/beta fold hydrolase n=1 Tax=Sphingosinithalassobacter sp. LHW66-3 TaxID=3424718 RepID=UPI003D6A6BAA